MSISRRKFFKATSAAALTAGALLHLESSVSAQKAGRDIFDLPAAFDTDPLTALTLETFTAFVNTTFTFHPTGKSRQPQAVDLTLTATKDLRSEEMRKTKSVAETGDVFSLSFSGSRFQPLGHETYLVQHDVLGTFSLMIVVIGSNRRLVSYEAVINRLRP